MEGDDHGGWLGVVVAFGDVEDVVASLSGDGDLLDVAAGGAWLGVGAGSETYRDCADQYAT